MKKGVYVCAACGGEIQEGEDCYYFRGERYHEDCFRENAVALLEDVCGAYKEQARRGNED